MVDGQVRKVKWRYNKNDGNGKICGQGEEKWKSLEMEDKKYTPGWVTDLVQLSLQMPNGALSLAEWHFFFFCSSGSWDKSQFGHYRSQQSGNTFAPSGLYNKETSCSPWITSSSSISNSCSLCPSISLTLIHFPHCHHHGILWNYFLMCFFLWITSFISSVNHPLCWCTPDKSRGMGVIMVIFMVSIGLVGPYLTSI